MELTVIRTTDSRRMVVSVQAADEREALNTIQNAIGPVTVVREKVPARPRRTTTASRHARAAFSF